MSAAREMKSNYQVQRAVRRELAKLKLDKAERILVKECSDCPAWLFPAVEECGILTGTCSLLNKSRKVDIPGTGRAVRNEVPPHDCPLRTASLSIAIDPAV